MVLLLRYQNFRSTLLSIQFKAALHVVTAESNPNCNSSFEITTGKENETRTARDFTRCPMKNLEHSTEFYDRNNFSIAPPLD
jgi:hypothetical protein